MQRAFQNVELAEPGGPKIQRLPELSAELATCGAPALRLFREMEIPGQPHGVTDPRERRGSAWGGKVSQGEVTGGKRKDPFRV